MNVTLVDSALFAFLFPSLWEIEVAVAASVFVILAYRFFTARTGYADPSLADSSAADKEGEEGEDYQVEVGVRGEEGVVEPVWRWLGFSNAIIK